jgi:hypothetical protein
MKFHETGTFFKNNTVTIFIMSLGIVVIGFTSAYFAYIVHVKGGDLLLKRFSVLVSWPDEDPSLVPKLAAI